MTVLNLFWTPRTLTHTHIHTVSHFVCCNNSGECRDKSGPAGETHTHTDRPSHARDRHEAANIYLHAVIQLRDMMIFTVRENTSLTSEVVFGQWIQTSQGHGP